MRQRLFTKMEFRSNTIASWFIHSQARAKATLLFHNEINFLGVFDRLQSLVLSLSYLALMMDYWIENFANRKISDFYPSFHWKRYHSMMLPIARSLYFFFFFGNNLKIMITDFAWWLNTIDLCWYNSRFILAFYNLENFNRECSTLFKIHWMNVAFE